MINTGKDINFVNITGNLMCDVTWKTNADGERIIGFFAVGTTRKQKDEYVTDRHSIVVKGPAIANFPELKKGDRVSVQGVLTYVKREGANFPSAEIKVEAVKQL